MHTPDSKPITAGAGARPSGMPRRLSLAAASLLLLAWGGAQAWPEYGEDVDAYCAEYDGSTPYADLDANLDTGDGCQLCHQDNVDSGAPPEALDWWATGDLQRFCTGADPDGNAPSVGPEFVLGPAAGLALQVIACQVPAPSH